MKTGKKVSAVLLCAAILAVPGMNAQTRVSADPAKDRSEIRHLIDTYTHSIDVADPELGAQVWLTTPDASFIEPLGHERGWNEIAAVVYRKLMGGTFSKRTLKLVGEPAIHVYGDAAVAEFDWDFVATLRSDGSAIHTTGRESQFYVRFPEQGWRLVHVHYSGPPVKGPGQGF